MSVVEGEAVYGRPIVISGDLASGKSSVAQAVADKFSIDLVSTGEIHRSIASDMNISTLELNRIAEENTDIDKRVDSILRGLAAERKVAVVDSRMAWWFMSDAISVRLTVLPEIGAERMMSRAPQVVEKYGSKAEAMRGVRDRANSERRRFRALYGVDTARLANYNLVVDTSSCTVEETVQQISKFVDREKHSTSRRPEELVISPSAIYPTQSIRDLDDPNLDDDAVVLLGALENLRRNPIQVGYSYPYYFVVDGHKRLYSAIQLGVRFIPVQLVAEEEEEIVGGVSANRYLLDSINLGRLYDWIEVAQVELPVPEFLQA